MRSVLLYIRRMSESRPHWARIRDLLFTFASAVLICGVIAVPCGRAQGTGQSSNAEGSAQGTGQSSNAEGSAQAQAPSSAAEGSAQGTGQSGNAEGSAQTSAPSNETQAPAESGGAATSPAQNGRAQAPAQNSRTKATGAHPTPEGMGPESGQSEPQEIQQPSPYQEYALAA